MSDPNVLLATLAQSAAAVVAIIGGFLVSRLVALSSEREGLRRQRTAAEANLSRVSTEYETAHRHRFDNSKRDFEESVLGDFISDDLDVDTMLDKYIPRGSSQDEMQPVLDGLIDRIKKADAAIRRKLRQDDDDRVDLSTLRSRGLQVPADDEDVYEHVVYWIRQNELPASVGFFGESLGGLVMPPLNVDPGGTSMRRLDESIRDEQTLLSRKVGLEQEIKRLSDEIEKIGHPVGVTSAIGILAIYSLLGIAAPLVVMVMHPSRLELWLQSTLLGAFLLGLTAILGYVFWYARTLNDE